MAPPVPLSPGSPRLVPCPSCRCLRLVEESPHMRSRRLSTAPSELGLGVSESVHEPLRVESQFPAAFRASWIRALRLSKPGVLRPLWGWSPGLGCTDSLFVRPLPVVGCHAAETTSLPLLPILMWPFYPLLGGLVQLVFRSFSEGTVPQITVVFTCLWEEVSLESSCATIQNPPPALCF